MIGMVLIGHGRIASEMVAGIEHVLGKQPLLRAVDVQADDDLARTRQKLQHALAGADTGDGVLLLADMFGGTPCNIALDCMRENMEVISGFNLPLLIKAASMRRTERNLKTLARAVVQAGQNYICLISELAPQESSEQEHHQPHA